MMAVTEIRNIRVFDGYGMTDIEKVAIENGVISDKNSGEAVIDGDGGVLLPGFIDSHVHLYERDNLEQLCMHGITTALDMANRSPKTYQAATRAGIDVLAHIPFTAKLSSELIKEMASRNIVSVPTVRTMKAIVEMIKKKMPLVPFSYKRMRKNMALMKKYDINFLAGTDANMNDPTSPVSTPYGTSFLDELELMVDCGLTPTEALRSATSAPAAYWGLNDRGAVRVGNRADLVLAEGDPLKDIRAVRNIKHVWVLGDMIL
jgi:imidazolonepropionase-like amidohydrolase